MPSMSRCLAPARRPLASSLNRSVPANPFRKPPELRAGRPAHEPGAGRRALGLEPARMDARPGELPRVRWRLLLLSLKNFYIPVLEVCGRESAAGRMQARGVEPVDPFQRRELDV